MVAAATTQAIFKNGDYNRLTSRGWNFLEVPDKANLEAL